MTLNTRITATLLLTGFSSLQLSVANEFRVGPGLLLETAGDSALDAHSQPFPFVVADTEHWRVAGVHYGWKAFTQTAVTAGLGIKPDSYFADLNDLADNRELGTRFTAGPWLSWTLAPKTTLESKIGYDISGETDGWAAEVSVSRQLRLGRLPLSPYLGAYWYDKQYSAAVFRRDQQRLESSSLHPFIGVQTFIPLSKRWVSTIKVDYLSIDQAARDLVGMDRAGKNLATLGVLYQW